MAELFCFSYEKGSTLHNENTPMQIYWNFYHKKKKKKKKKKMEISDKSRGGSNEYPKCMFLSRNKKNNVNP